METVSKQHLKSIHHEDHHLHASVDPHRRSTSGLSDIILGGQDGLVNVLGVILGVAAATSDPRIVLVAGLAATFAESVSMGAVAYTSTIADAFSTHLPCPPSLWEGGENRKMDVRRGRCSLRTSIFRIFPPVWGAE